MKKSLKSFFNDGTAVPHHRSIECCTNLINNVPMGAGRGGAALGRPGPIDDGSAAVGLGQPHRRTTSDMNDIIKDIVAVVRTVRYGGGVVRYLAVSCCWFHILYHF